VPKENSRNQDSSKQRYYHFIVNNTSDIFAKSTYNQHQPK